MLDATPLLRWHAKRRNSFLQKNSPVDLQRKQLFQLIQKASNTQFAKDHGFSKIKTVTDYQSAVPLRKYEDFWEEYWKPLFPIIENCTWPGRIPYFSVSSGTSTGTTKYLPYTYEMSHSNNKAGIDILVHHVTNKPDSKLLGGLNFMLGGSTALVEEAPGIFSGDLSGISVKQMPWWIRPRYFPPADLALLSDWEEKIQVLAEECLKRDIRMIGGVPSWMLIFIDKLTELKPDVPRSLRSYFPNLELLIHGGVNFSPYQSQFLELLEGSNTDTREVYPASEGFIATADRGYGEGLKMNLDHQIFYEFIPFEELGQDNPTRHWIENVEPDVNYAIALTTCAGSWSYILGDTVRFVDTDTPRIVITGRTSYMLSAFGEHLIAEEVEDALSYATDGLHFQIADYCVGPIFPNGQGDLGGHLYVVELQNEEPVSEDALTTLSEKIDERLCKRNEDYEAHRSEGYGLKAPEIRIVPHGFFAAWMKSRGKLGGQHKVPRLISNPELFKSVTDFSHT